MEDSAVTLPFVSICMAAYNAENYIADAIRSVIGQSYTNWELIIVNDGSTDRTEEVILGFSDKRIKLVTQINMGQGVALNNAFKISAGELIKFFDADDILSNEFLADQVENLSGKHVDVASARWGRFVNNDLSTFKLNPEKVWKNMRSDDWLVESWMNGQPMMQCALWLIPRRIIDKAGLWDERLTLINDFDFFTRIIINSNAVIFCNKATLFYRSGLSDSVSGRKTRIAYESAFLSTEKAINALLAVRNDSATKLSCANIWQYFIFEVFPGHPDLIDKAKSLMTSIGKPTIVYPCGGLSKFLLPFLGWKLVKRLQRIKQSSMI